MNMVEKVAKAVFDLEHGERTVEECKSIARTAIQAMREPSMEMLLKSKGKLTFEETSKIYTSMIDAALK